MNIGMLWFDNDPKTDIAAKIQRAAAYYRHKYGQTPDICFIHPTMLPSGNGNPALPREKLSSVEVRTSKSVRPHYFWIGVNEAQADS
ncbi:MAG: hypothetical protein ACOY16_11750 [Chloroflexota bacterium]|jgi:hypothetical protein